MKNIILFCLALCLFSCHKEPIQNPCFGDGIAQLNITNGFQFPVEVTIFPFPDGEAKKEIISPYTTCTFDLDPIKYVVHGEGNKGGIYASYPFDNTQTVFLNDCEAIQIVY